MMENRDNKQLSGYNIDAYINTVNSLWDADTF